MTTHSKMRNCCGGERADRNVADAYIIIPGDFQMLHLVSHSLIRSTSVTVTALIFKGNLINIIDATCNTVQMS